MALAVDVISDVVCPWCYLGKRRLEAALLLAGERDARVRWRPYQLDETIPPQGRDRAAHMRAKFPDADQIDAIHARLTALGTHVGIAYRFDAISRAPNTLAAHRLIAWAGERGDEGALVERLFKAYFSDGLDVGDSETLAALAGECGYDAAAARAFLVSDAGAEAVRDEINRWRRAGVSGVPCFVFAQRIAVSGAQGPETLALAIAEARRESAPSA